MFDEHSLSMATIGQAQLRIVVRAAPICEDAEMMKPPTWPFVGRRTAQRHSNYRASFQNRRNVKRGIVNTRSSVAPT